LVRKRLCGHCGAKFYDLHHSPITCPKCDTVFDPVQVISRWRAEAARAPVRELGPVADETLEAQFVSSEHADTEAEGKEKPSEAPEAEDEVEPDEESLEDAAFIEESEEEDTDVTAIIGTSFDSGRERARNRTSGVGVTRKVMGKLNVRSISWGK
jgi:uncharacterized protein (TIGR02300 family)